MPARLATKNLLEQHVMKLNRCRRCSSMSPPVISCGPVRSRVILIGQAPGPHEASFGRPFAWTAGKTMFRWFEEIGIKEEDFRVQVYMAAVCRCFPGKNPKGGDRVPDEKEIANCRGWLEDEFQLLQPKLAIPVGKLAISQFMECNTLKDIVGKKHRIELAGVTCDAVPLPHPSGASTWHRTEPGKSLLKKALKLIQRHAEFDCLLNSRPRKRKPAHKAQ